MHGAYLVIEGIEGSGKSQATAAVVRRLQQLLPDRTVLATRHPGATPLGAHIRLLNKYPERIDPRIRLDPLSSQMLMVVDNNAFVQEVLQPALRQGAVLLADRSNFITSIAYGVADGLSLDQIDRLFSLAVAPRIDRLYVLRLPWQQALQRMRAQGGGDRGGLDRFERKGDEFFQRVEVIYNGLVAGGPELAAVVGHSVALEDICYIDATQPPEVVAEDIVRDACRTLTTRL